jgi:hypothetical protein
MIYKTAISSRLIVDTAHAIERFAQRHRRGGITQARVNKVISDGMVEILTRYKDREGIYIIHSKSTRIGIVIHWRRQGDPRLDDGDRHAIIVTILPLRSRHLARDPEDILVTVENLLEEAGMEKLKEHGVIVEDYEEGETSIAKFDENFLIVFFEGKYYDSNGIIIEV